MKEEIITSTSNRQVKRLVKLMRKPKLRKEENVFVTEGIRMFRETPADRIREVCVSERFFAAHEEEIRPFPYRVFSEEVFACLADTKTPQGVLCVVERTTASTDSVYVENGLWLLLEDIQDPGNLGTILRTAEGAGVSGVFLSAGCADVFSPKVVRSTMGSIYRMPFVEQCDLMETVSFLKEHGVTVYAAGMREPLSYECADYRKGTAFLIGNEGSGLSDALAAEADRQVSIPMHGELESLNAAMAAGILVYEAERQRRTGGANVSDLGT